MHLAFYHVQKHVYRHAVLVLGFALGRDATLDRSSYLSPSQKLEATVVVDGFDKATIYLLV